jgi:hypothetical protein
VTTILELAVALVRGWTRLYTGGMPALVRDRRRAEIESDLWESTHDDSAGGVLHRALQILVRLAAGMPSDLWWRLQYFPSGPRLWIYYVAPFGVAAAAIWFALIDLHRPVPLPTPPVATAGLDVIEEPLPPPELLIAPPPPPRRLK